MQPSNQEGGESRPRLTFDLDGVLCRPPFGINPGRGKTKRRDTVPGFDPLWRLERWRYRWRQPMPGAVEAFRELNERYECVIVSARGGAALDNAREWFKRHFGIDPPMYLRPAPHETSAQYKARVVPSLSPCLHLEDDPHTARWLSELIPNVVLVDWSRNRWLSGDNIHRVASVRAAIAVIDRLCAPGGG